MNKRYIIPATVLASLLVASVASAQVTSGVGVTSNPGTGSVTPGSGVTLGTIQLTGSQTGAAVSSVPLTFTGSNGGLMSNLSNCQIYNNATGQSLTTGSNAVGTIGSGSNSFNLNSPLTVSSGAGTTTLSVRCDVAANTPAGATFSFAAGSPTLTSSLNTNLDVAPSVPAGSQDVALANIFLGTGNSSSAIRVSSIPLSVTAGGNAIAGNLTDCRVRDASNLDGSLSGSINPAGGNATYTFNTPLVVGAGMTKTLSFTCDVSSATPTGGTFTIGISPSGVVATDVVTGATVTPTAVVGAGPNGLPAASSGTVIVSASTGTGGNGGTGGTGDDTPGIPNTGAGDINTMIALALAGIIALGGTLYLRSQIR